MKAKDIILYTIIHVEVITLRNMKITMKPQEVLRQTARRGLTIYGVAVRAGISPTHMYNMMSGRRNASPHVAMRVARVLGVDVTELFEITYLKPNRP